MDDWKIIKDTYVIVLFEYYMENYSEAKKGKEYIIKEADLKRIIEDVKKLGNIYIFLDMKYIYRVASRAFAFFNNIDILDRIVFFQVEEEGEVSKNLAADLRDKNKMEIQSRAICFSEDAKENFNKANIEKDYQQKRIDVLIKYINRKNDFLASSGIYSNMFLDYKRMFEYRKDFQFCISELYYLIQQIRQKQKIDYLVATSKNSIVLTSILSQRLEIEAICYTNIGQKYVRQNFPERREGRDDNIQSTKKYLMIFDVVCLGTEVRILNGIINAFGGDLIGAIGLVCVQDINRICKEDRDSVLGKIRCLATTQEMGLNYRIALTREELEEV